MWIFSLALPTIAVCIGNYRGFGLSHQLQYGFPLFTQQNGNWWSMGLFILPTLVLNSFATIIMVYVMYRISSILLGKEDMKLSDSDKKVNKTIKNRWAKMLAFNQRSLLFLLFVGIGGIISMFFFIDMLIFQLDKANRDMEDYLVCLLLTLKPSSLSREDMASYPKSICGTAYDQIDVWGKLYFAVVFEESFGMLPLIVYGVKGHIKTKISAFIETIKDSIGSKSVVSSEKHSVSAFLSV